MAKIEVYYIDSANITARIIELGYPQNQYLSFRMRVANGSWHYINVTSSTSYASGYAYISGLVGGTTYTLEAEAQNSTGWWPVPSLTVTTPRTRPSNWSWYSNKSSGGNFNITAAEWNAFCTRINDFRRYKGLSAYTFATVYSGNSFTATHYNHARNAIYSMNTNIPQYANSGDTIYASDINHLMIGLNGVT